MLTCRPGQIATFPLNGTISQSGLVVAFDLYPYPDPHGSNSQVIFSIRNTATDFVSLRCAYLRNIAALFIAISEAGAASIPFNTTAASSVPLQIGK